MMTPFPHPGMIEPRVSCRPLSEITPFPPAVRQLQALSGRELCRLRFIRWLYLTGRVTP